MWKFLVGVVMAIREDAFLAWLIAIVALSPIAFWVVPSYFEARAYERVTGRHVSTFDAMFLDLRVQSEPKQ